MSKEEHIENPVGIFIEIFRNRTKFVPCVFQVNQHIIYLNLLKYKLKSEDNSLEKTIFHFLFLPSLSTVLKEILSKPEVYSKPSWTSKGR